MRERVRIGGAAGFWGDSLDGARQLIERGDIDYLVFDYLAEITLSLLARLRAKNPERGFVPDFSEAIAPWLGEIKRRGIRVISNSGGVNPPAAAAALAARARAAGVPLSIAVVTGDDLMDRVDDMRARGIREMFSGAALPEKLMSANAYLGAQPIAAALARGADVVITGRCVDSAVTLGALAHAFAWSWDDYDRLAQGSLAGHLLECSAQATGGLATDWRDVPGWDDMGLPIAECAPDGSFVITKPENTGGRVTPLTVGEQMLYEIGDPASYVLPDVICDFRQVTMAQDGPERVRVTGAHGRPPTEDLKVSATWHDGFRTIGTVTLGGPEAAAKAQRVGEAILARSRRLAARRGLSDFTETSIEVLGAEATYGPHARAAARETREVVLKIGARHADESALELLAREIVPAASSMAQGLTGFFAGRPSVQPVIRLFSLLWPKSEVVPRVQIGNESFDVPFCSSLSHRERDGMRGFGDNPAPADGSPSPLPSPQGGEGEKSAVPLLALAVGRSGDKGNNANIGIIARRAEYFPWLSAALTAETVAAFFAHTGVSKVERHELPGLCAFNFVLHDALGGGGVASLRIDPQGKAFAQMLMDISVPVPAALAAGGPTTIRTGRHFEDYKPGERFSIGHRMVSEADIATFANLTDDLNPLHVDERFAAASAFGGRIAHGPMIIGMAFGLGSRARLQDGTVLALLGIEWEFPGPVRPGDTIEVFVNVLEARPSKKPDRGVVTLRLDVVNQHGEMVQVGRAKLLVRRR